MMLAPTKTLLMKCFSFKHFCYRFSILGWSGSGSGIRDHSDHSRSNEPLPRVDSFVHLIYHDPSDQKITDPDSDPDHLKGTHPKATCSEFRKL